MKLESAKTFTSMLECGVRDAVLALRSAGINTTSSCHHEGWIEANSSDPTNERLVIWNVMYELGIESWVATMEASNNGHFDSWRITSRHFLAELHWTPEEVANFKKLAKEPQPEPTEHLISALKTNAKGATMADAAVTREREAQESEVLK